jgi:hypothetical protein
MLCVDRHSCHTYTRAVNKTGGPKKACACRAYSLAPERGLRVEIDSSSTGIALVSPGNLPLAQVLA